MPKGLELVNYTKPILSLLPQSLLLSLTGEEIEAIVYFLKDFPESNDTNSNL
jgi:hypothetical protein